MANLYDSEDVDVKAKNVHIDLEPHEHEDTYEALGRAEVTRQEEFMAAPHSNIGEGSVSPWTRLSRMDEADLAEVDREFQDYDTPVHPHLQKARDTLKQGLGWTVDQIRKAVPNLDKFSGKPGSAKAAATGAGGVPDMMPGPGGYMHAPGKPGEKEPKPIPGTPGAKKAASFTGGPKAGEGGYWELAKLVNQLEQIPSMPSDQVMQRLQTVSGDLHKLKNSLKKNPSGDPEQERMAKSVESALQAIPAVMKSAGALVKSTGTDKGLWQDKMTGRFNDPAGKKGDAPPENPMASRVGKSPDQLGGHFMPKSIITHPTGQDPKLSPSKADKEKAAEKEKQASVQQKIQPQVRKAGEKEPEKGPVKPKADMSRVAPKVRKAGDKEDKKEPEKKEEPKKDDKKESAWRDLAALLG